MAGYGRYIFMHTGNLLCTRSCLVGFYQNVSKNALKSIKQTIFPPKPKRPETAFLLYLRNVRPKYVQEEPRIKPLEVVKKASREWAELDPSEKEHFQKQYDKCYRLYTEELKEYNDSITDEQRQLWEEKKREYKQSNIQADNKRKSEAFGKPKKPLTAFLSYMSLKKSERDPNIHFLDWMKSLTETWNKLPDIEKEPFVTQAAQSMAQYRRDLDEWETKMISLGHLDVVRRKTLTKYKHVKSEE